MNHIKKMMAVLLSLILSCGSFVFAESLDTEYVDLLFNKFEGLSEQDKKKNAFQLRVAFQHDASLDALKDTYLAIAKNLVEDPEEAMERIGLTHEDVVDNIDRLKTWTLDDRKQLVEYCVQGEKEKILALNRKNGDVSPGTDETDKSPSGSSGALTNSGGVLPADTDTEPKNEEKTVVQRLNAKGMRVQEIKELEAAQKSFDDLERHWSKQYVEFFANRGIISGRSDTIYDPDASISRAEIITLITKIVVEDPDKLEGEVPTLLDVGEQDWYHDYIMQGIKLGFVEPGKLGMISPVKQPERQEIIHMLVKTLDIMDIRPAVEGVDLTHRFTDTDQIQQTYYQDIQTAVALGWISGMGDGRLAPEEGITRGQIAVMLQKFYETMLERIEEVEG